MDVQFIDSIKMEENAAKELPGEVNPRNVNALTQYVKRSLELSDAFKQLSRMAFFPPSCKQAEVNCL